MNPLRKAVSFLAAASVALVVGVGLVAAATAPMQNPPDKAAIEKIVHDYLVGHPEVLIEMSSALDAKNAAEEAKLQREALAKLGKGVLIDSSVAYLVGPPDAKVTMVEFFDYRCVHCKNSLPAVRKVVGEGKVRFAFIEHPILTEDSLVAAHAAVAARRQTGKYVPFHFALMSTTGDLPLERILKIAADAGLDTAQLKRDMNDPAVAKSVQASNEVARKLHIEGTPTFVIGNKVISGELTYKEMQKLIKEANS